MESEIGVMRPQPKDAWSHQRVGEAEMSLLQSLQSELGPTYNLILDFWSPHCENAFLLF